MPAKLRTKKGCVTCRDRRKKCDERKPVCEACGRLGYTCHWPNLASLEDRRRRAPAGRQSSPPQDDSIRASASPDSGSESSEISSSVSLAESTLQTGQVVTSPVISLCYPSSYFGFLSSAQLFLRSDREVELLTYYSDFFVPANILPKAHRNFSRIYSGDSQELKDSVLACSAVHLANRRGDPPIEALLYYTRAVSGLRRRLNSGEVTGLEDWLLSMTVLLHCFETWRCDEDASSPGAFQHLLGAIQLLKLRCSSPVPDDQHDLCILMAESVLFHVSTLAATNSSFATLDLDSCLWDWIEIILQKPAYEDPLSPVNHPVLGTPRKLNRLVFEISKMSMRFPLSETDLIEGERLNVELLRWENGDMVPGAHELIPQNDPYSEVKQLYIFCARIVLLRMQNTRPSGAPEQLKQFCAARLGAIDLLSSMEETNDEIWNFSMRWPLLVLGSCVDSTEERDLVKISLERIWQRSSCGEVRRSLDKLTSLWSTTMPETHQVETEQILNHQGLDEN